MARFADRRDAGRRLARALGGLAGTPDLLVLGLARGGVPVAFEVARALHAELDVLVVRKLGVPGQPELAMGAIGAGGVTELNPEVVAAAGVDAATLHQVEQREQRELQRREQAYRGERAPPRLRERTVIVVDDGIATGASMRAALGVLRRARPARMLVAVPVAPRDAAYTLCVAPAEFVALLQPHDFGSVGRFYDDFGQTEDDEVRGLLTRARATGA
ncbi:MAG: phosphoribosyltransferase [Betaproteobacteria bacterium]|nr:phosphoribosyltransferase [Betaproteobacteria bacterium]